MKHLGQVVAVVAVALSAAVAQGAGMNCHGASNVEEFRYSWRLRGGLAFVAGFMFPTSGVGNMKTTFPRPGEQPIINSELLITAADAHNGFYVYESQMDPAAQQTFMTYHGYSWGKKSRKERTVFDYVKRLAHMRKETPDKVEDRVKPLPPEQLRDVLTAIYFLRQNAGTMRGPIQTVIYSDGNEYPVLFRAADHRTFDIDGAKVDALGFEIVDAPGGKKWPGGIRVYLSNDSRRIPFRIEIRQSMASLQLDLQSVESCAFMQASR